jgi:Tol biopolymer transport system component
MRILFALLFVSVLASCKNDAKQITSETLNTNTSAPKEREALIDIETKDTLIYPEEGHFKNIRQVTYGGDNAEAYWSFDDKQLVFQSNYKEWGVECDQMFLMNADQTFKDSQPPMISTGKGRTTCAYFLPDNKHYVYGSTHLVDDNCPEVPLRKNGNYVWPVYDSFDIFVADLEGNITAQLTTEPGYDAEATVSPQ